MQLLSVCCVKTVQFNKFVTCTQRYGNNQIQVTEITFMEQTAHVPRLTKLRVYKNKLTNTRQQNKCLLQYTGYMFRPVSRSSSGLQQGKSQVLFWILGYQYLHLWLVKIRASIQELKSQGPKVLFQNIF